VISPLDPYEAANQQKEAQEPRLVQPQPATRSRKPVIVGLVIVAVILCGAMITGILQSVGSSGPKRQTVAEKPVTMTDKEGQDYANQQDAAARFMRSRDQARSQAENEDAALGKGRDLANEDPYAEAAGVPPPTRAQSDVEHGRTTQPPPKSEAQLRREKRELEREHRRQNDLDSTPGSIDFSDYFQKTRGGAANPPNGGRKEPVADPLAEQPVTEPRSPRRLSALQDALRQEEGGSQGEGSSREEEEKRAKNEPQDPKEEYVFDQSYGKLYRLFADSIIETALVNRLTGAAAGPVITMVTTDVYSFSGVHLLIPKGTRLLGTVTSVGSTNQERLFVAFNRMIMPDGYSVSLDKFKSLDVIGQTGLRDLVNHHYALMFGSSLALAGIAATTNIGNTSGYGQYDWGVQMRVGASQQLGQSAQRVLDRFLNILPTFTIRERARVKVMLSQDMILPDTKNHAMDADL
jgi:type IV secretion system protein TrbI